MFVLKSNQIRFVVIFCITVANIYGANGQIEGNKQDPIPESEELNSSNIEIECKNIDLLNPSTKSHITGGIYIDEQLSCTGQLLISNTSNANTYVKVGQTFVDMSFSVKMDVFVRKTGTCCWHVFTDKNCRRDVKAVEEDKWLIMEPAKNSISVVRFEPVSVECRPAKETKELCPEKIPEKKRYACKNLDVAINTVPPTEEVKSTEIMWRVAPGLVQVVLTYIFTNTLCWIITGVLAFITVGISGTLYWQNCCYCKRKTKASNNVEEIELM